MTEKLLTKQCLQEELERLRLLVDQLVVKENRELGEDEKMLHARPDDPNAPSTKEVVAWLEKSIEYREKRLYFLLRLRNQLHELYLELSFFDPNW